MNEKEKRGIIILVVILVVSAVAVVLLFNEKARNRVREAWADIRAWFRRKFHKNSA